MTSPDEHYRRLERLYESAPVNELYSPEIHIERAKAEIACNVRPEFMHAAAAVHGSIYFKLLDDACFFAVNSLVEDVFVLTSSFTLYLLRPVTGGTMKAAGAVVHSSRRLFIAEGRVRDGEDRIVARGSGTFMRSTISLNEDVGYA